MLSVKNLHASIGDKEILRGINLEVRAGEVREVSLADADSGVYVVVILKEGKAIRSFKIVK